MKKGKVFFHPIEGSGALTISWSEEPKRDAIEAKRGSGVGFYSKRGDLLCVIFDEVKADHDQQILEFARDVIEIRVNHGRITYDVVRRRSTAYSSKIRTPRRRKVTKIKK